MNFSAEAIRRSISELGVQFRELDARECQEIRQSITKKFCYGPASWMIWDDLRVDNPKRPIVTKDMSADPSQATKFIPQGRTIVFGHEYEPDAMWEFASAKDAGAVIMNSTESNSYATNRETSYLWCLNDIDIMDLVYE